LPVPVETYKQPPAETDSLVPLVFQTWLFDCEKLGKKSKISSISFPPIKARFTDFLTAYSSSDPEIRSSNHFKTNQASCNYTSPHRSI
jgi:hypothetical protein